MTSIQREEKMKTIKDEILKVELKINKLLLQREQLGEAYEKVRKVIPKDPQPVSLADREKQSQLDKKLFEQKLRKGPQLKSLQLPSD
jgi:hypothetical protein